ncbi:MAG: SPFH domain-containing protein [Chloroflexota bacterium]
MTTQSVKLGSDVEVTSSSPDDSRLKKSWGYIVAYPHEYLIHFRGGRLSQKTSGQGASCFKWPRDTVFIIPTSLKEIVFQANQLSVDNVDVRLRGMAIYRINNPMQIYTMLNFANRQQAEEKLARMIGDLCRSTAKWLVANMGVEECLRKRKEDIAEALKREVSLVVADQEKGWGVGVVTIDIQDVYIQDAEIFSAMQILFKTEKLRESELSRLEMQKDLDIRKLQQVRELAEHRKNTELESTRIEAEVKK